MGKLPKSMQNKKKQAHALRSRGSRAIQQSSQHIPKGVNRQMRRRMQQQGLEGMEQIDAERVIIQTVEGESLVIEAPQVIKVDQQGVEAYQIIGTAEKVSTDSLAISSSIADESLVEESDQEDIVDEEIKVEIKEEDVQLVAMQTGVSHEVAKAELENTNGDLAKAIINLKTK